MKFFDKLLYIAEWISGILLFAMMLLIIVNAGGRTLIGTGIPDDVEILSLIYVGVIFLALAPVHKYNEHIRVEFLVSRLPLKLRRALLLFSLTLELFFFMLITLQSYVALVVAFQSREDFGIIISVPTFPARFVLLLGCILMIFQIIKKLISNVKHVNISECKTGRCCNNNN